MNETAMTTTTTTQIAPPWVTLGNPVYSLQTMLRTISFYQPTIPSVVATGNFDEATLEAVMLYQRDFYPPVTGVVNYGTWQSITQMYFEALSHLSPPTPCAGYPFEDFQIQPNTQTVHLPVLQGMLYSLSYVLDNIKQGEVNGMHSGETLDNIMALQQRSGLSPTGVIDRETWNMLSRLYALFVSQLQSRWLTREEVFSQ